MSVSTPEDARSAVSKVPYWYHSIELAPGVETPGHFDLRPTVEKLPWPDVQGKRCLDIGTWDGFFAFELERRGAAQVVAIDIPDHTEWDWPLRIKARGVEHMRIVAGPSRGHGFELAREHLGSSVTLQNVSAYDVSPERTGQFDVVVCGSLLLHLRDPMRALAAIHSVCSGAFLSTNQVDLMRSVLGPQRPLVRFDGTSDLCQWFIPNAAAHRRMIEASGFQILRESNLYSVPFGEGHPQARNPTGNIRSRLKAAASKALRKRLTGNHGVPHHAVLAKPATH